MSDPPELIAALVTLLGDPNPAVHGAARKRLLTLGPGAMAPLEQALEGVRDPETRGRIVGVLECLGALELDRRLEAFGRLPDEEMDLERGAALLASIAYPDHTAEELGRELDRLAEGLAPRLARCTTLSTRLDCLCHHLYVEHRLHGEPGDGNDPDDGLLHRVILRRHGLPIALAAITVLVGRRVGLPVYGVAMPCHYIAKAVEGGEEILFDPWSGGARLSRDHCAGLLGSWGIPFRDAYLEVASPRATLARMCRNLLRPYWRRGDHQRLGHVVRFLHALEGGEGATGCRCAGPAAGLRPQDA
ncbi:MAG: hypothetical protein D6739_13020 [Nitrospirae bacterium]|nr:MAG: hypothetical protein D6739_13020 [Nitrospirota bacterium]